MPHTAEETNGKKVAPPNRILEQLSDSGTPRYKGETAPDDYVRELADPVKRMAIFEEMRYSDEAVNTAISAREHLISSSNWKLATADDTPRSREILAFVEDNLYPVLPDLLRWLGGSIQYGFSLMEPVFTWSDAPIRSQIVYGKVQRAATQGEGRRIYLRKLAHMRQRTVYTFVLHESGDQKGDLKFVRQYVLNSANALVKIDIEPEKLLLWTYNRQGDDYWGVPPTRHIYKAWTFKRQIEGLGLLNFERFGVGIPVASAGPGWTAADYTLMGEHLKWWRSSVNSYLVHPDGGKVEIISADGGLTMSMLEFVRWYTLGIAKTFLTQQSELGSTETGARAVGEVMVEQMEGAVQADDESIAALLNERLIVPLVLYNFGPQPHYPAFTPSQRVKASSAIGDLIASLAQAGVVSWNPMIDEPWLRDAMGLPDLDLTALAKTDPADDDEEIDNGEEDGIDSGEEDGEPKKALSQTRALAPRARATAGASATSTAHDHSRARRRRQGRPAAGERSSAKLLARLNGVPEPAVPGTSWRTPEYSEWESRVLRPDVVTRDLDLESVRLAAEVQAVLREIDAALASQVKEIAEGGAAALAQSLRSIKVGARLRNRLRDVLTIASKRARVYGNNAVKSEIARQDTPESPSGTRAPDIGMLSRLRGWWASLARPDEVKYPTKEDEARELVLKAEIDRAVEEEIDRREGSARSAAALALTSAAALTVAQLASAALAAVRQALESLSPARTESNVAGVVNVGFGIGRRDAADELTEQAPQVEIATDLVSKVYSAVLDGGTCEECARYDGAEYPIDYPEDARGVMAPNPKCYGSYRRCRCLWIYVTRAESKAMVPPAGGVAA